MVAISNRNEYFLDIEKYIFITEEELIYRLVNEYGIPDGKAQLLVKDVVNRLKKRFPSNKSRPYSVFHTTMLNIVAREIRKLRRVMEKNFELTEDQFYEMVKALQKGNEQIYEQIFLSHFKSCLSFVKHKYSASHQDAYDATMDAMLAFMRKLKDGSIKYGNLRFLFTQMAGQMYLKWVKRESRKEGIEGHDESEEQLIFGEENIELLGKAWIKMGDQCKSLLNDFYYNEKALNDIAEQLGKSASAIRKQKQRCIEKLREFFIQLN